MNIRSMRYYRGGPNSQESIELDLQRGGRYVTTCVVNVMMLLCGITTHPCGNGDDFKIPADDRIGVLRYLQQERRKLTQGVGVKTMDGWRESGLPTFEDYCFPGDTVAEDIADYFLNVLPPVTNAAGLLQAGEEHSMEYDADSGRYRATFVTFHRAGEGLWKFDGYCFRGSTENRTRQHDKIDTLVERAKREVERECTRGRR